MTPEFRAIAESIPNPLIDFLRPYAEKVTQLQLSSGNTDVHTMRFEHGGHRYTGEFHVPADQLQYVKALFDEFARHHCKNLPHHHA